MGLIRFRAHPSPAVRAGGRSPVLPDVPLRQWVLTVPWPIRRRLAADGALMRKVLGIFVSEVFRWLAETTGAPSGAKGGAVAVTQRFGGTLNLHVHYHVLVLDGVYTASNLGGDDDAEGLVFQALVRRVTESDERCVAERVYRRMLRLFRRRGWIAAPDILSSRSTSHIVWVGRDRCAVFPGPRRRGLRPRGARAVRDAG